MLKIVEVIMKVKFCVYDQLRNNSSPFLKNAVSDFIEQIYQFLVWRTVFIW